MVTLKQRVFDALEFNGKSSTASKSISTVIITLVSLNVLAVVLETVPSLSVRYWVAFRVFEFVSVVVFSIEYILRLWSCSSNKQYQGVILGRMRFALTPFALVDLVAVLPFFLPMFFHCDLRFIRVLRLMRLFRLLKTTRYFSAFRIIMDVLRSKKEELYISLFTIMVLLVFASCLMFMLEHDAQPKVFSSIPAAMWWGVVTMTTVGYGDIYPLTVMGKVCGAVIAMLSMGLFALPAGILASGFIETIQNRRKCEVVICPHCGEEINDTDEHTMRR